MDPAPPAASFVLFTDAPPLREGGFGCHILSRDLLEDLGDDFGLVLTRRLHRWVSRTTIFQLPGRQTLVFPDAPAFRPARLRPWIDMLLFLFSLPWLIQAVRSSGCQRVFALFGADAWFLLKVELLRRATGLPLDIDLVDDLEESARHSGRSIGASIIRHLEPYVLRRAARVFVISQGYAEHLAQKYHQTATLLPLSVRGAALARSPYQPTTPDQRAIVFLGSVNPLYLDGLVQLYEAMTRWNRAPGCPYELRLRLLTRTEPRELLNRLPDRAALELVLSLDDDALHRELRSAWAVFLTYTFDPAWRVMVSTSFSHKFTESMASGRPILVYGPAYASLPRHFQEAGLPLCAQTPAELAQVLGQIEENDQPTLVECYRAFLERCHATAVLRRILAGE